MRVVLADDEPLARARLTAMLAEVEDIDVVGEAANGREALEAVARLQPDVLLMDIRMPVMDGLEAARHLATLEPASGVHAPGLIFCTAFDDHALAAFEANAVDYLLKPVRAERLRTALVKARRWTGEGARSLEAIEPERRRSHLCARVRGSLVLVPVTEIDYLLAEDKYVLVHHAKGEVLIEESLKSLEQEFADMFVRIHRNCLVAQARLGGLVRAPDGRLFASLDGKPTTLEVSRRNLPSLRKLVKAL